MSAKSIPTQADEEHAIEVVLALASQVSEVSDEEVKAYLDDRSELPPEYEAIARKGIDPSLIEGLLRDEFASEEHKGFDFAELARRLRERRASVR